LIAEGHLALEKLGSTSEKKNQIKWTGKKSPKADR